MRWTAACACLWSGWASASIGAGVIDVARAATCVAAALVAGTRRWEPRSQLPLRDQLPAWAAKPWAAASAARPRRDCSRPVNPFYQRGDFDGDGRADLAILVRDKATGKIGILVLHRVGKPTLLGAGRSFGNGGDDFAWIDQWSVDDRGSNAAPRRRSVDQAPLRRAVGRARKARQVR